MKTLMTALVLGSLLLAGCSSGEIRRVEAAGPEAVDAMEVTYRDFAEAADKLLNKLYASNALADAPRRPAVMYVERVKNNTRQHIDVDLLVKQIREDLNASGLILTTTAYGKNPESKAARAEIEYEQFMKGSDAPDAPAVARPDYVLTGKIIEMTTTGEVSGGRRAQQNTYIFQMSLTDKRGLAVWDAQETVSKVKPRAGFRAW